MTIEEQLKAEVLSRYKSVRAFTTAIDIPYSTLDSAFKRGLSNAGVLTMIKVFSALDLDIESIRTGTLTHSYKIDTAKKAPALEDGDEDMLELYHQLNRDGRLVAQGEIRCLLREDRYRKEEVIQKQA